MLSRRWHVAHLVHSQAALGRPYVFTIGTAGCVSHKARKPASRPRTCAMRGPPPPYDCSRASAFGLYTSRCVTNKIVKAGVTGRRCFSSIIQGATPLRACLLMRAAAQAQACMAAAHRTCTVQPDPAGRGGGCQGLVSQEHAVGQLASRRRLQARQQ